MKTQVTFAAVAVLAAASLAAATPASATLQTFANVSNVGLQFSKSTGMLTQINSANDSYAAVSFVYDTTALTTLGSLAGGLTLSAAASGNAQTATGFTTQVGQPLGTGSFSVVYEGPTETVDTLTLTKGVTVLLSGSFTGGAIIGDVGAKDGEVNLDTLALNIKGGTLTYSSDLESFLNPAPPTENSLSLTTSAASTNFVYHSGQKINSFTGSFGGNFSSDPGPVASIPEPASWAMMLIGVGLVGGTMRRRVAIARAA